MRSRYKLADVENLKSELDLAPEVDRESREVGLKDAMKLLLPVLKDMRQHRGYTLDQLLTMLHEKGIQIAKSSLKDYLRSSRRGKRDGAAKSPAEETSGATVVAASPVTSRSTTKDVSTQAATRALPTSPAAVGKAALPSPTSAPTRAT
jgi:hypothetical protein